MTSFSALNVWNASCMHRLMSFPFRRMPAVIWRTATNRVQIQLWTRLAISSMRTSKYIDKLQSRYLTTVFELTGKKAKSTQWLFSVSQQVIQILTKLNSMFYTHLGPINSVLHQDWPTEGEKPIHSTWHQTGLRWELFRSEKRTKWSSWTL